MKEKDHSHYLGLALQEARKAFLNDEVPIGAVLVNVKGKVVARGYNQTAKTSDITKHAELIVIEKAAKKAQDWRLEGDRLYVTLEPCLMCLGATVLSRIKEIHFVLADPTFGSVRSVLEKGTKGSYRNVKFFQHEELGTEVAGLMKEFFEKLRKKS